MRYNSSGLSKNFRAPLENSSVPSLRQYTHSIPSSVSISAMPSSLPNAKHIVDSASPSVEVGDMIVTLYSPFSTG